MTNGEKIKEIFPSIELCKKSHGVIRIYIDSDWWNSEYKEPKWIPVSERLPKKNVWVLVTFKMENGKNSIDIKRINQWNGQWEDEDDMSYNQNIIAWMPLPKPYREVEDE